MLLDKLHNSSVISRHENIPDTHQCELSKKFVVVGHLTFALANFDFNLRLAIGRGTENLGFLCGDCRIAGDQLGKNTAKCFDTERQWCHIEQEDICDVTGKYSTLK